MPRLVIPPSPAVERGKDTTDGGDEYLTRVAKYVPAEIVGAYLAGQGVIIASSSSGAGTRSRAFLILAAVLLVCTPLYLRAMAKPGQPWRKHAVVGSLAFAVWVYALAELPRVFDIYSPLAASLALILFTVVSGLVQPRPGEG